MNEARPMAGRWGGLLRVSSLGRATLFLFAVDAVTNVVDYGFHIYLGRKLLPGDFAAAQAINAALLIVLTMGGVFQPAVARQVVEAGDAHRSGALFRAWLWPAALLGAALSMLAWLGRAPVAAWLGVPTAATGLASIMLFVALARPVVGGMLQGSERFVAFGALRATYALARLASGVILISLGGGLLGAVAAMPVGGLASLLAGLGFLGSVAWKSKERADARAILRGLELSLAALVAFGAYMLMMNNDLLWANRSLAPQVAGAYATAVLLRRVVSLLPGAAIVVMYPRAVARVASGTSPDRLLLKTGGIVLASGAALTAIYFALGPQIIRFTFGAGYETAGALLGVMGLAMVGYSLASIWMNLYLAIRPGPYVAFLAAMAIAQSLLLSLLHANVGQIMAIFAAGGWTLALGGLALYLLWTRPSLREAAGVGG